MGGLRRHLAGYLPINILQAVLSLVTLSLFTRLLTPREYGVYTLCITAILWIQGLSFQWLILGMGRFVEKAHQTGQFAELLSTAYRLFSWLTTGWVVVAALLSFWWDDPLLVIASVSVLLIRALVQLNLEIHRNSQKITRYSVLEGLQSSLSLTMAVILIGSSERPALAPLWGLAGANVLVALLDIRVLYAQVRQVLSLPLMREIAHYGAPLALASLLSFVVANADRFLIAWFMDPSAVGRYAVAYGLADRPLLILFNWVGMATTPLLFSAMQQEGHRGVIRVMEGSIRTLILFVLPASVGLAAVTPTLVSLLVGQSFQTEVISLLPWLIVSSVLHGFALHYFAHVFLVTKQTSLLMWTILASAVINILLNLLWIPMWGLFGAVLGTLAAYALELGLNGWLGRRYLPIPLPLTTLGKGLAACTILFVAVRGLDYPASIVGLVLAILAGMIVYGLAILLLDVAEVRTQGWFFGVKK
ncbi:Lipopolysaccharide biosynthesis protein [Gammaproteobacteria bacterium]